jgi:hypothetical protein
MLSMWLVLVKIKFDKLPSSIVSLSLRKVSLLLFLMKIGSDVKIQVMVIDIIMRFCWEWDSSSYLLCMIIVIIIIFWHEWYYNKCDNCYFDDNLKVVKIIM